MACVKGSSVRTRRDFVLRHYGEEAWERVLAALAEEDRALLRGAILATSWYPFGTRNRLEQAIVRICGGGDDALALEIGAFSGSENLTSLYRSYVADGSDPRAFYARLARLYPTLYDFGTMRVHPATGAATLEIHHDFAGHACRTNCLVALGFFRCAGQAAGIRGLRIEERACQVRGDARCIFSVRWTEREGRGT